MHKAYMAIGTWTCRCSRIVQALDVSSNLIDTVVVDNDKVSTSRISFFYDGPHYEDKLAFWTSVMNMGSYILDPLIYLGDFNELVWRHEKFGGGGDAGWCNSRVR